MPPWDGESLAGHVPVSVNKIPDWLSSAAGAAGGTWGFLAFFLARLWIGIAYLKGEGDESDESVWVFWRFAGLSFVYLPAIVAALVIPPVARWGILLAVAGITQVLAFWLATQPAAGTTGFVALPASLLLVIGAAASLRRWRETRSAQAGR